MNKDANILNKILETQFKNTSKRSSIMIKWYVFRGCKDGKYEKIPSTSDQINKQKGENHMIVSIDAEKAFEQMNIQSR